MWRGLHVLQVVHGFMHNFSVATLSCYREAEVPVGKGP